MDCGQARGLPRLGTGGEGELGVAAAGFVAARVGDVVGEAEVLHLGRDARGEGGGVEDRRSGDPRLALKQALPHALDGVAHRGDPTHSGDDDTVHARTRGSGFKA